MSPCKTDWIYVKKGPQDAHPAAVLFYKLQAKGGFNKTASHNNGPPLRKRAPGRVS